MEFEDDIDNADLEIDNDEADNSLDINDGVEDPDAGEPVGDGDPGDEAEAQAQAAAAAAAQAQLQAQDPRYNNLAAQHRILSRQNRTMAQQYRALERQHAELIGMVKSRLPQFQEEQLPDPEEDLGGHLVKRLDRFEKMQEQERQERARQAKEEAEFEAYSDARSAAVEFRGSLEDPMEYDNALMYLGQLAFEEALEEDDNSTEDEIRDRLAAGLVTQMKKWHSSGANPGEKLLGMARRRGFRYEQAPPPQQQQQQQQPASPRAQIREQKSRQQKGRTITNLPGSAASSKSLTPSKHLQRDEEDWVKENRDTPIRDLLKGKGRREAGSRY